MSNDVSCRAGAVLVAAAALLLAGCATTAATTQLAAEPDTSQDGWAKRDPRVRVLTREQLEQAGGAQDLPRALSLLVPGLTVTQR